jgi:hypothetical protein
MSRWRAHERGAAGRCPLADRRLAADHVLLGARVPHDLEIRDARAEALLDLELHVDDVLVPLGELRIDGEVEVSLLLVERVRPSSVL